MYVVDIIKRTIQKEVRWETQRTVVCCAALCLLSTETWRLAGRCLKMQEVNKTSKIQEVATLSYHEGETYTFHSSHAQGL